MSDLILWAIVALGIILMVWIVLHISSPLGERHE